MHLIGTLVFFERLLTGKALIDDDTECIHIAFVSDLASKCFRCLKAAARQNMQLQIFSLNAIPVFDKFMYDMLKINHNNINS